MAALQNFRNMTVKKKMLILGDMRELGAESAAEHRKIVDFLQECSFEKVLLVGEQFTASHPPYHTYANAQEVIKELQTEKPKDYTILIKGSNGIKPVSYTHLDVYKRQLYRKPIFYIIWKQKNTKKPGKHLWSWSNCSKKINHSHSIKADYSIYK